MRPGCTNGLFAHLDLDGVGGLGVGEFAVGKGGCAHLGPNVVGEGIGFFGDAESVLIYFATIVHILIEGDGVGAELEVGEFDLEGLALGDETVGLELGLRVEVGVGVLIDGEYDRGGGGLEFCNGDGQWFLLGSYIGRGCGLVGRWLIGGGIIGSGGIGRFGVGGLVIGGFFVNGLFGRDRRGLLATVAALGE